MTLEAGEREAIEAAAGRDWRRALGADPAALAERSRELAAALDRLEACAGAASGPLAQPELRTLEGADEAAGLSELILSFDPVPEHWLEVAAVDDLERDSSEARELAARLRRDEEALAADYSEALVDRVDEAMLIRYRTDHQSLRRRLLGGAYRRDRRVLQGHLRAPRKLPLGDALAAVELALEVGRNRERWREIEPRLRAALGTRFRGRETDWERVAADLAALRRVLADWRGDADILRELVAGEAGGGRRLALEQAARPLADALAGYRRAAEALGHEGLNEPQLEVAATGETVRRAVAPLERAREATAELYGALAGPPEDVDALRALIESGVQLTAVREEDERLAPALAADLGALFGREATDWEAVSLALDWTSEVLAAADGRPSERLRDHVAEPRGREEYLERAEELGAHVATYRAALAVLDQRFDVGATRWETWEAPPLADLEAWATDLRDAAGEAPSWVAYREAVGQFEERFGAGSAAALRSLTDRAEDVPPGRRAPRLRGVGWTRSTPPSPSSAPSPGSTTRPCAPASGNSTRACRSPRASACGSARSGAIRSRAPRRYRPASSTP